MNKYLSNPEYILDLHGKTRHEALHSLAHTLQESNYYHVRIITGKGTFRENVGVLRGCVKNFLTENNIHFHQSKISDGGEGAFEVYIQQTAHTK
jgi:DNA-nicking Smr family endonuclease